MSTFNEIPVVSLERWRGGDAIEQAAFADEVRRICHEVGFFSLVDHGVPGQFLADYHAALQAFFALPRSTSATPATSAAGSEWARS